MGTEPSLDPIVEATESDVEDILNVIGSHEVDWDVSIAEKYYRDFFNYKEVFGDDKVYKISMNSKTIGVIGFSKDRYETDNYWLGWFYVHNKFCRQGVGRRALKYVEGELSILGVKKLYVDTSSNAFYKDALVGYIKFGFKIEAIIKDYYGVNEDQLILSIEF